MLTSFCTFQVALIWILPLLSLVARLAIILWKNNARDLFSNCSRLWHGPPLPVSCDYNLAIGICGDLVLVAPHSTDGFIVGAVHSWAPSSWHIWKCSVTWLLFFIWQRTNTCKRTVNVEYLSYLRDAIVRPLTSLGVEGVPDAVTFMDSYCLMKDDVENIMEISSWGGKPSPFSKLDPKVKFTILYPIAL